MTKKKVLLTVSIVALVILFTSPLWVWQMKSSSSLDVLVIDKTVPDESYREHKGLIWLLNHLKLKKQNDEAYDVQEDYVGFVPSDNPPTFDVRTLPEDLSQYDLLYVADGYGVYEDEYVGENREGDRSELLYGGITEDEVNQLNTSLIENNQTLVAEFNTFGSPTGQKVRDAFYHLLNLEWSGWMGRYFTDLSNAEVPVWLKGNYEKQYGEPFTFEGRGLVFVDDQDKVIVLTDEELSDNPVLFSFTDEGQKHFSMQNQLQYNYWFDIVEARNSSEIQATYKLSLSNKAEEMLASQDIPLDFPAVIHHQDTLYDTYYFAGDFVDHEKVPDLYQLSGLRWWQQLFSSDEKGRTDAFFWKVYLPMMEKILTSQDQDKGKDKIVEQEVMTKGGVTYNGSTNDEYLQVYKNGAWEEILIKGVNMGIAKPGTFPGETGITKEEYARWFEQISEMNANALRIYTIHPPAFYQALYEHNVTREDPLYLFHGVWINEDNFLKKMDVYDPEFIEDFQAEIKRIVDIIHGNATIEPREGHASGTYNHDLSPYLLGWVLGIEWDPEAVYESNEKNKAKTSFEGEYFKVENGQAFETWMAEMMDFTATYEADRYQWQHPMSFTNWVTTDLLTHPAEPSKDEDLVSIDPNKIKTTDDFYAGMFASYHIYPYYPDFLNYEEEYVEYVDHRGEKNNYAGYLHDMKKNHDLPLVVAEFGVPASRGLTHENVYGLDQGNLSEKEQGEYVVRLFEDIVEEGMAGGMVFSWQDEWFKRTWNTMEYDNEERRPFWSNIQTNEQAFGLLSFDPDTEETEFVIDGNPSEWETRKVEPIYNGSEEDPIQQLYVSSDSRGIYLRFDYKEDIVNQDKFNTYIALDTIENQGQSKIPNVDGIDISGADFLIELKGEEQSRVLIDSYYDTYYYDYGQILEMIPKVSYANKKNNGVFHPINLTLNKEWTIKKGEESIFSPFSSYETGKLLYANGNPEVENSNTLADFYRKDGVLEVRIPWLMLNVKDPSQKEVMGDIWSEKGLESEFTIDGISAKVVVVSNEQEVIQQSSPNEWLYYTWENWQTPSFHERLKESYPMVQEAYDRIDIQTKK
ncbi:hypothetical protein ACNRWW_17120 [Metabacillus sp. HB246100]|uniref:hypothetical protein n=1 Tax=Bacillus weihaiensis TaxID=1547283 RepID=UPI00235225B1|nr:hypothetical protein [Bacillus weihaiensis]